MPTTDRAITRAGRLARAESLLREAIAAAAETLGPDPESVGGVEERGHTVDQSDARVRLRATLDESLDAERSAELAILASILDSTSALVDLIGYGPDPHLVAAASHQVESASELSLYIAHHRPGPLPEIQPEGEQTEREAQ